MMATRSCIRSSRPFSASLTMTNARPCAFNKVWMYATPKREQRSLCSTTICLMLVSVSTPRNRGMLIIDARANFLDYLAHLPAQRRANGLDPLGLPIHMLTVLSTRNARVDGHLLGRTGAVGKSTMTVKDGQLMG